MEIVTIYITLPTHAAALDLARTLVEEQLAACANIIPGVTSVFRWEGKIEQSEEVVVLLKTRESLVGEVSARVQSLHSYECPCIVAWKSNGGNEQFFRWVHIETGASAED